MQEISQRINTLESRQNQGFNLSEVEHFELGICYLERGTYYLSVYEAESAISDYNKSILLLDKPYSKFIALGDLSEKCFDTKSVATILFYSQVAQAYYSRGQILKFTNDEISSIEDFTKAIDLYETVCKFRDFWEIELNLTSIEIDNLRFNAYLFRASSRNILRRDTDEAIADCNKCIEIANELSEKLGQQYDESFFIADYSELANGYDIKGEYDKAVENHNNFIDVMERLIQNEMTLNAEDASNLANSYMNRGACYNSLGKNYEALRDYDKCSLLRKRLHEYGEPQDDFDFYLLYLNISNAYHSLYDMKNFIENRKNALNVIKSIFKIREEMQTLYYVCLSETLDILNFHSSKVKNVEKVIRTMLKEFLDPMRLTPKTTEAEIEQNKIITKFQYMS